MKYHLTTTIKKSGPTSMCVYIPRAWDMQAGLDVSVALIKTVDGEESTNTFLGSICAANKSGGQKISIPRVFGLAVGDWITIILEPIRYP